VSTNPLLASVCGYIVGAIVKYLLNYFVAFQSKEPHTEALIRFSGSIGLLFVGNAVLFLVFHDLMELHYMAAQVATTLLLIPAGYLINSVWVFR
jgi:putative flippase GtrA